MRRGRRRQPFKLKLKKETIYTFSTVGILALAGLTMLSFSRQGQFLSQLWRVINYWFGWGALLLPFLLIFAALMLSRLQWRLSRPNIFVGGLIFFISLISLSKSGVIGLEIWQNLAVLITGLGAFLVLFGFAFVGLVIIFETSLEEIFLFLANLFSQIKKTFTSFKRISLRTRTQPQIQPAISPAKPEAVKTEAKLETELLGQASSKLSVKDQIWQYPPLTLLEDRVSGKADRGDIKKNAEVIEKTLESFGISARVAEVNFGPAVTQYALEIALGTKLSKVTALSTDLAMALAAPTGQIRIEAPIPGRSLVGVEVPNRTLEFVTLKQMLSSDKMKKAKTKLMVSFGLNVSGEPVVDNLARMPHVLIAGATGSGKSVCIHSFISTILFRATPEEVKFILVDPKRVELTAYNGVPHLLTPVIVEPDKVLSALKWAISEMDRRYKLFAEVGARNIDAYNELSGFTALPYILVVIDELADIILFSPAEVEDAICRIAQMARATGIHLIISTQRPSVDVLTGLIKANIPCRIAFNVTSQVDSRVILDTPGAEKLLGRGDMLYIPPDQAKPTRIQGAFVSEMEIKKLIDFLKKSGVTPVYTEEVMKMPTRLSIGDKGEPEEKDEFFDEAVRVIRQYDRASASLLQRRLKVGYARAARILDQLERMGVVGPADGAKPREVFLKNVEEYLASEK
jgi:S-DNA-T family DNA segregation ATPase FtsK/SpoIIIE